MSVYSPIAEQPVVFDEKLIAKIARRRARAHSWDDIATEFRWDADDLCYTCDTEPAFAAALERAQKEVEDEADAEGMHKLRELLRDSEPAIAMDAAKILLKYVAEKRRDATRLAVEKMRAEAKMAATNARCAKKMTKREQEEWELDNRPPTPEEVARQEAIFWRQQEQHLADAYKPGSEVYVWGGTHALGQAPTEADVRVVLIADGTVPGHPRVYWAVRYQRAENLSQGPFPVTQPAAPRVHDCPPEVAEQIASRIAPAA